MKRWTLFVLGGMLSTLAACGADSVGPTIDGVPSAAKGTTTGTDTTNGQPGTDSARTNPNTPTSNGPVASLTLTPHELTLPLGYYGSLAAIARDAAGVRVIKQITWRSSSASVVVASDTGVIYAKSLGTAKIYASVDGFLDSTTVTVVPAPTVPTQPTTPAPVSSFNLKVVALGAIAGADTSSAERMAGATVTVLRIGEISGDTLATPQTLGTATTDANGEAKFTQLPGGFYTIRVAPPSGSAYSAAQTSIAPPRYDNIFVTVTMRKP